MALPTAPPASAQLNLSGHAGHLTEHQQKALAEFKEKLAPEYFTDKTDSAPASHDDPTLLRFLRARKFDVGGAYTQFTQTEEWRKELNLDELYSTFDVEEFDFARAVYPQWTGRRTKTGLPLYEFKVGKLTKELVNEYSKKADRLDLRMAALSDNMIKLTIPLASAISEAKAAHEPISGCVTIVNISNVSLTRFWSLRTHMQRASILATAHYPETLGAIYIVGAPGFFSTVWGWIGKWFDPGTVEKIFILAPNDVLSTLSKYIEPENIPKEYGGQLNFSYGDPEPNLGSEEKEALGVDRIVRGPNTFTPEEGYKLFGTGHTEEEKAAGVSKKQPKAKGKSEVVVEAAQVEEKAEKVEVAEESAAEKEPIEAKLEALAVEDAGEKELFVDAPEDVKLA